MTVRPTFALLSVILFGFVLTVTSITQCDPEIVQKIMSTNKCPNNVQQKYRPREMLVSRVLAKDSPFKCLKITSTGVDNFALRITAVLKDEYKSSSSQDLVYNFAFEDQGCGSFTTKVSDKGLVSVYYKKATKNFFGLYICANDTTVIDGTPTPVCSFPLDKQYDDEILKCKNDLQKTMPNVPLVIMPDCTKM